MYSNEHHESPPFFQVGGNWQAATLRLLESQGHSRVRRAVERGQDVRVRSTAGGFRILALFWDSDRHANWRTWLPWSLPAHLLLVIKRINYGMQGHGDNNKIPWHNTVVTGGACLLCGTLTSKLHYSIYSNECSTPTMMLRLCF